MTNELPPGIFAREAADMDTPPERLEELARYPALQPIVATNPATPSAILLILSTSTDPIIRRAVAKNPNTPVHTLSSLAGEFPLEFSYNPILPFLNMTEPGFIKNLPLLAWSSLLRNENIPTSWFKQLQMDQRYQRRESASWQLIQLHVKLSGEASEDWNRQAGEYLKTYQKNIPEPSAVDVADTTSLFMLFVLLVPQAVTMLKEEWVQTLHSSLSQGCLTLSACTTVGNRTMTALAAEKNTAILCRVARHPLTSTKLLMRLARQKEPEVRRAVASNSHTPLATMQLLASDVNATVRRIAATYRGLTQEDLEVLALDPYIEVRAAVAAQLHLDGAILKQLATDTDASVRAAVARNVKAPQDVLITLTHDTETKVRAAVAGNPCLPADALDTLLSDAEENVRACLAGNARLSEYLYTQLALDRSSKVRRYLAANPRSPVSLLETLWQVGDMEVWSGIAHHPGAPSTLLEQLALKGDLHTRAAVAAHQKTPVAVLSALAEEPAREIQSALLSNPQTPLNVLEQIIASVDPVFWPQLIKHPVIIRAQQRPFLTLLTHKLQQLVTTNCLPTWFRRVLLQYYTTFPPAILEPFVFSPYWQDRYLVARHPRIAQEILQTLAQDGICYVRAAARNALEQRQQAQNHDLTR